MTADGDGVSQATERAPAEAVPKLVLRPARWENASRVAALTARAVGASTAVVHLMQGNTLEVVGQEGIPAEWVHTRGLEPAASLARLVMAGGFPVVIDDVLPDARVSLDSPARPAGINAYAGFPIRTPDGTVVGVCCALELRPRAWAPDDLAAIAAAAAVCTAFIEEVAIKSVADEQGHLLDALFDSLRVAVAACDADGRLVRANAAAAELGISPSNDFAALRRALGGVRLRDVEITIRAADESARIVLADATPITSKDGRRLGAVAALRDVTYERRIERFRGCGLAVAAALATAASLEMAGPSVLAAVAAGLGWPYGELWIVERDTETLRAVATYAAPESEARVVVPAELRYGHGFAGTACRSGETVWVTDPPSPPLMAPETAPAMRSALAVPVTSGHDTAAVLVFFTPVRQPPQDVIVTLLTGVAAHVGQSFERRRADELGLALARSKDEYLALVGHETRPRLPEREQT